MHKISIAPMLDVTYNHFRVFMRLLTRKSVLWTEMIHENTILHSKFGHDQILKFSLIEKPLVLQLGGNSPDSLAKCAKLAQDMGYDEINLNVGCPSSRVQSGAFGACLMKTPDIVVDCMNSLRQSVDIPVTVKCRLGVDDFDSYEFAYNFVKKVHEEAKINHFIIHARKAFLKGLNPKENRNIPPLQHDRVKRLKQDFPHIQFSINGGFKTIDQIKEILSPENRLHGCMIGRAAMDNPWLFSDMDRTFYGEKNPGYTRRQVLKLYAQYCDEQIQQNPHLNFPVFTKPITNLFFGCKNNAKYRQHLAEYKKYKLENDFIGFIDDAIKIFDVPQSKDILDEIPPV